MNPVEITEDIRRLELMISLEKNNRKPLKDGGECDVIWEIYDCKTGNVLHPPFNRDYLRRIKD